ncbi:MAG: hypothetical protein WC464_02265 [Bdellovibrionales bacterium]
MQRKLILFFVLSITVGCSYAPAPRDQMEYYPLGSSLTQLSRVIEGKLYSGRLPADLNGDMLLKEATRDNPNLLLPFGDYKMKANRSGRHVALLVCDKEETRAILEDAGCTGTLEKHLWQAQSPQPCEFSIDLITLCKPSSLVKPNGTH